MVDNGRAAAPAGAAWRAPASEAGTTDPGSGTTPAGPGFARVKEILDGAVGAWRDAHHREPRLAMRHGATFGWATKDALTAAAANGFPLIDAALVGTGQGEQTNLVVALRSVDGVEGNGRMPNTGPYLPDEQIDEIARWIDAGMPD